MARWSNYFLPASEVIESDDSDDVQP